MSGTLHYTAKAVINKFKGDIHPGDIFVVNDVYQGGTHFNDTRIVGPMFYKGELLGFAQANGHWADVGGAVPGSFNVSALDHMAEGLRITPVRVFRKGVYLSDVAELIANNTRAPADIIGDLQAQAEACRVAEREVQRLCDKYGVDVIKQSFAEVQDYVETLTRQRILEMPNGVWETTDYIDVDPVKGEGMIPIHVKMTIDGDHVHYDLSGSHPTTDFDLPELLFRRRVRGDRRRHQNAVAGHPAELRILSCGHGRPRAPRARSSMPSGRRRSPASARGRSRRS